LGEVITFGNWVLLHAFQKVCPLLFSLAFEANLKFFAPLCVVLVALLPLLGVFKVISGTWVCLEDIVAW
jgi:hypothetical protein